MFTRRFVTSIAGSTLTAAALGMAALGLAGTATASSVDQTFLAALENDGITPPSAAKAIRDAHIVCKELDKGHSGASVISAFAEASGLSTKSAKKFAIDAALAYCPEYVTST